jgi:hypothetical protein
MTDDDKPKKFFPREPGSTGAFHRIKSLRCFKDMREKLVDGWSLGKVAEFIQEDNGESTDISKESLIAILHKYKKTIPAGEIASKTLPPAVVDAMKEATEAFDELQALEELFKLQRSRISIDNTIEKNIKKLMPTLTQDIRVATEIALAISKLKNEKGLTPRHLGTITHDVQGEVSHTEIINPMVTKVLENAQSRRKVLGVMQRLLVSAEKLGDTAADTIIDITPATPAEPDDISDIVDSIEVPTEPAKE